MTGITVTANASWNPGRKWQAQSGQSYRYFMVFKNRDFGIDGAYTMDQFVEIMKEL